MSATECRPSSQELRALLGSFGLGTEALREVRALSGGQRVRLALAKLSVNAPHMLILDEPTNHLDIYSIDALQARATLDRLPIPQYMLKFLPAKVVRGQGYINFTKTSWSLECEPEYDQNPKKALIRTKGLQLVIGSSMQDALKSFSGGVVVISHNQSLLRALDCEVLVASAKDRRMKRYEGGVEAYLERQEQLAAKREAAAAAARPKSKW